MLGFLVISASGISAHWLAHGNWVINGPHGGVGDYSTYLILVLPFLLLAAIKAPIKKFPSNLVWLLLPILLMGGYLTLNRAFWPALIVVSTIFGLLYFFRTNSPRINKRIIGIAILLGILAVTQFISVVKHKAAPTGTDAEIVTKAMQEDPRISLWKFAIKDIRERPLTGAGFGRGAWRQPFHGYLHAHNLFLDYALQMGVGGLLALMLLFWAIGREFWMLYRAKDSDISLIGIVGLALLCGVIAKNMTDDFFVRQHALLFWALVGMCLGYGKRRIQKMSPTTSS
jgi:O-antigen ligase